MRQILAVGWRPAGGAIGRDGKSLRLKPVVIEIRPDCAGGDEWARPDLDWRPPGYQPGAPTRLSYGPAGRGSQQVDLNVLASGPRTLPRTEESEHPPIDARGHGRRSGAFSIGRYPPRKPYSGTPKCERPGRMEVLEAIKLGRSASRYKPDPVPEQKVQTVVNAARLANSAENLQPWKFIVVSDEDTKRKLAGMTTNSKHIPDAPVLLVACARLDEAVAM